MKVMSVFGTRPEAIKMCPLVLALEKDESIESVVCVTGQHRQMLDQVIDIFQIKVDFDLNIMRPNQTLTTITTDVLTNIEDVLKITQPDIVLVHGDTSTSFVVALAAFYQQIAVGHVEAGLRTYDKYSPFPEEINRVLTGHIATLHFAPTQISRENLLKESISGNVFVTGNTVIDAFKTTVRSDYKFKHKALQQLDFHNKKLILMTAHRRENLGDPLVSICDAIKRIAEENIDVTIVYPVHLNPAVRAPVFSMLGGIPNVMLIDPIDVEDMHNLLARSYLSITDSGGLQEEAPSFGVPVLVIRTETERPEAVHAGTARIVGVKEADIYREANKLLHNSTEYEKMSSLKNPYGDGNASGRIVAEIKKWYNEMQERER